MRFHTKQSLCVPLACGLLLSGCVGNRFYRQNGLTGHEGQPVRDVSQQDRFIPRELADDFAGYTQIPNFKQTRKWHPVWPQEPTGGGPKKIPTNYFLSFIELDEYGELWYRSLDPISTSGPMLEDVPQAKPQSTPQLLSSSAPKLVDPRDQFKHAVNLIRYAKHVSQTGRIRLVVFIHGWKNNASDSSNNVWGFRHMLCALAGGDSDPSSQGFPSANDSSGTVPVVGIYIGWRGSLTNLPVVKEFTFANRRDVATTIPGPQLVEVLKTLGREAKRPLPAPADDRVPPPQDDSANDGSPVLFVGHSFGGLLLERAVSAATAEAILTQLETGKIAGHEIKVPFDQVVLVNSAAQATEAHQLISLLQEYNLHFHITPTFTAEKASQESVASTAAKPFFKQMLKDTRPHGVQEREPNEDTFLFLAITSSGDSATRIIMPIGETVFGKSPFQQSLRDYRETGVYDGFPRLMHQSTWAKHSVANTQELRTHKVCAAEDKQPDCPCSGSQRVLLRAGASPQDQKTYCLVPLDNTWNRTPYWASLMPPSIVPDHGDIFTDRFVRLLLEISKDVPEQARTSLVCVPLDAATPTGTNP